MVFGCEEALGMRHIIAELCSGEKCSLPEQYTWGTSG